MADESSGSSSSSKDRWPELARRVTTPSPPAWMEDVRRRHRSFRELDPGERVAVSEYTVILVGIAQVLLLAACLAVWWYVGAALVQGWAGVATGLAIAAGLDVLTVWALRTGRQGKRWDLLWWLKVAGYVAFFLVAMLVGTVVQTRIWNAQGVSTVVTVGTYWVGWWMMNWSERSGKEHGLPWPWIGITLVLIPGLAGWAVASLPLGSDEHTVRRWIIDQRAGVIGPAPRRCPTPLAGTEHLRVAVTLSGGGYRAAVTHTGLLAGLDAHCVPVHVLSTVSGGSIAGAAYALGVPPAEFAARLARRKPGLPTAVVSMRSVLLDLWWPTGSIAEVYREHFEAAFFGPARLGDLPETPLLLVNATDPEAGILDAREVFFRGRAPRLAIDGRSLDQHVRVADVVAASGAFPGAFRPKLISWTASNDTTRTATAVQHRKFLDGGIIDNFGVEGLRRYLTIGDLDGRLPARPHVLIVSDASGYGSPASINAKADAASLLQRSTDYSYEALHRHLYARYTGRDNLFAWIRSRSVPEQFSVVPYAQIDSRLVGGTPEALVTVAIPMTASIMRDILARYPHCRGEGGEEAGVIQRRVSALSTLYELDPGEVRDAFWLGYAIAGIYRPAIVCAAATALGLACTPPADAPSVTADPACRLASAPWPAVR